MALGAREDSSVGLLVLLGGLVEGRLDGGDVLGELAEQGQTVKGAIIALEDDLRIRHALRVTQNIDFYRYEVSFSLKKETTS